MDFYFYISRSKVIFFAGFNIETLEYKNISFDVWDIGAYDMVRLSPIINIYILIH